MRRFASIALVALLVAVLALPVAHAQGERRVRIRLVDGSEVAGVLSDYQSRVYRIRVGERIVEIPESEVERVVFVRQGPDGAGTPAAEAPPTAPAAANIEALRRVYEVGLELMERGEYAAAKQIFDGVADAARGGQLDPPPAYAEIYALAMDQRRRAMDEERAARDRSAGGPEAPPLQGPQIPMTLSSDGAYLTAADLIARIAEASGIDLIVVGPADQAVTLTVEGIPAVDLLDLVCDRYGLNAIVQGGFLFLQEQQPDTGGPPSFALSLVDREDFRPQWDSRLDGPPGRHVSLSESNRLDSLIESVAGEGGISVLLTPAFLAAVEANGWDAQVVVSDVPAGELILNLLLWFRCEWHVQGDVLVVLPPADTPR